MPTKTSKSGRKKKTLVGSIASEATDKLNINKEPIKDIQAEKLIEETEIYEAKAKRGRKKENKTNDVDKLLMNNINETASNGLPESIVSANQQAKDLTEDLEKDTKSKVASKRGRKANIPISNKEAPAPESIVSANQQAKDLTEDLEKDTKSKVASKRGRKANIPISNKEAPAEKVPLSNGFTKQARKRKVSVDSEKESLKQTSKTPQIETKIEIDSASKPEAVKEAHKRESKKQKITSAPLKETAKDNRKKIDKADSLLEKQENHNAKGNLSEFSDIINETKVLKVALRRNKTIEKLMVDEVERSGPTKTIKGGTDKSTTKGKRARKADDVPDSGSKPEKIKKEADKSKGGQSKKDKMPDVTLLDFSNSSVSPSEKPWNLKLSSWNINGIRAWLEKDGISYIKHESPDVICLQETKCSDDKLPESAKVEGYHCYWLTGDKEGYSGVGLLSKVEPISVKYGIGIKDHDNEGRVITAEYEKYFLVGAYVPNAGRGLVRLEYRMQWDKDFCSYLKSLEKKKPIILCGDLNVAHEEIDLANPKTNKKNAGFTKEERDGFSALLSEGFIDTFRHLYPNKTAAYTFWTYMMNARAKNVGWRLDYFVMSKGLVDNLCDNVIRKDVYGSDHCPITLFLSI